MIWQDWALSITQFVLAFALLPTIFHKHKPSLTTSALTSILLTAVVVIFLTLHLWISAIGTGLGDLFWYILLFQKWKQIRRGKSHD